MSSPHHSFWDSPPASDASQTRRSQFTYRNLSQMASYNTTCPLRVVAHIDLDCFYAQAEMVRLGVDEELPFAVQQWQGLIAVNYPARAYGIGRHCTVTEAKKLCPKLIHQHVATWREGDDTWAYHPDAADNIATDKVSLDPYRLESRRVLATIKEHLPQQLQKVEKASIDEVFLDLSAHTHAVLLERFPELAKPPPDGEASAQLPMPPISALDWQADELVDLDDEQTELDDPDWDDVALLVASEIVRSIRATIREKLGYTCSAGIAKNKLLSKLGSAHKKPNQQTVIRNRAVRYFLSGLKFTKIRNLGGKLGEQVRQAFNTESVQDLHAVSVEQLKLKLGDDTGVWIYNALRGVDTSEVNSRTQIKSMLSAKSFRPSINTVEQGRKWLRIFVADIFSRLVEEGVLENKRRPRTINLHHRHDGQMRSRQSPIPQGRPLDEDTLFGLAKSLLDQLVLEGRVWPCANLSLSVGGFQEGVSGNKGIDNFLLKGEEAQVLRVNSWTRSEAEAREEAHPAEKRRRIDTGGIQRFFARMEAPGCLGSDNAALQYNGGEALSNPGPRPLSDAAIDPDGPSSADEASLTQANHQQTPATAHPCPRCDAHLESSGELQSHQDWHLAKDLQEQERVMSTFASQPSAVAAGPRPGSRRTAPAASKKPGRPKKAERGQTKLSFG
ncbi:DNA-directed DNA polymerase eta rad30 [Madurella fahalii]|uniref:DNA polymerase eta n=1 Tax=Madurella fahalii TaxID=1157608 RepID=A0ABQ0G3D6_9PEZI